MKDADPKARVTIESVLAAIRGPVIRSPADLRVHRAVFVLEQIGTHRAAGLLKQLADNSLSPRAGREARFAYERLRAKLAIESQGSKE